MRARLVSFAAFLSVALIGVVGSTRKATGPSIQLAHRNPSGCPLPSLHVGRKETADVTQYLLLHWFGFPCVLTQKGPLVGRVSTDR